MRNGSPTMTPATRRRTFSEDFHGGGLRNETQDSGTDPEVRLMRKEKEAGLAFMGHALMENRNGPLLDFFVSRATGRAERDAAAGLLDEERERGFRPGTLGGDRGYDTRQCVKAMCVRGVTPRVARRTHSSVDGRTTRHSSYGVSRKIRKQVEEIFRRMKTVYGFGRARYRGVERTGPAGYFVAAVYNLLRRRACCHTGRLGPFSRCELPGARCGENRLTWPAGPYRSPPHRPPGPRTALRLSQAAPSTQSTTSN